MRTRMSGGMTGNAGDRLPMSICSGRSEGVKVLLCVAQRCGNDAPWKAWKTQKASFPLFPPRLEIRQKAPDSHISTAPTAAAPQTQLSGYSPTGNFHGTQKAGQAVGTRRMENDE